MTAHVTVSASQPQLPARTPSCEPLPLNKVTLDGDTWYSLDGRRLEGKPATKGVYINNNNKVIIK